MIRIALLVDGNESLSPGGIDAAARGVEIQIVHYADTGQAGDQLVRPQVEHQQTRRLACADKQPPARRIERQGYGELLGDLPPLGDRAGRSEERRVGKEWRIGR